MRAYPINSSDPFFRRGSVYLAVLGTSLIASLLGLATLTVMRIQNRQLTASMDIRQAQLNAQAAIQLGRLIIDQTPDWRARAEYTDPDALWFTYDTGLGTCSLQAMPADPAKDADATARRAKNDALLADPSEPVKLLGIGREGQAEQFAELIVAPQREPLKVLSKASSKSEEGKALEGQATKVDWDAMVAEYQAIGTEIPYGNLPSTTTPANLARNPGIESALVANDPNWTGAAPGLTDTALVSQSTSWDHSGNYSLRVSSRTSWQAGAVQRIEHFVKPGQQYDVEAWASIDTGGLLSAGSRAFQITLHVKGSNNPSALVTTSPADSVTWTVVLGIPLLGNDAHITGRLAVPTWSGDLEYAFVKIADAASSGGTAAFYVDDLSIREVSSGRYIYRKQLSPSVNSLYTGAPTGVAQGKSHGVYWIDCEGNRLIIERSRILGTLLVLNPGSGSRIDYGPIHMAPAKPGYPALVVHGDATHRDFTIRASKRGLSEFENQLNYNPVGAPYDFGTAADPQEDADTSDIYPSEIRGLVAVSGNLSIANSPAVHGPLVVGGTVSDPGSSLVVEHESTALVNPPPGFRDDTYQPRASSVAKVVSQ